MSWPFNYNPRTTHGPRTSLAIQMTMIGPKFLHHGRLRRLLRSIQHAGTAAVSPFSSSKYYLSHLLILMNYKTPQPPDLSPASGDFSTEMSCADARVLKLVFTERSFTSHLSLFFTASAIDSVFLTLLAFIFSFLFFFFFFLNRNKRIPSCLM